MAKMQKNLSDFYTVHSISWEIESKLTEIQTFRIFYFLLLHELWEMAVPTVDTY